MLKVDSVPPQVRLSGTLALETATQALKESDQWLSTEIDTVDLSAIDNTDSSAIALMLEWQRRRPDIKFVGVPAGLLAVAKLSDLEETINFA